MTAKKTAAKKTAKKATPRRKAPEGECYAGDGRPATATALTAFGPRPVCERHAARARAAGRVVR